MVGKPKVMLWRLFRQQKKGISLKPIRRLADANAALLQAHKAQTEMLTREAQGEETSISLLMVHAQDHLMTSLTFVDLAKEVVEVYERFEKN